jgi:hypothetical protein
MTPKQRDAQLALARPADEQLVLETIQRRRARLEAHGLLGLVAEVALEHDLTVDALLSPKLPRADLQARRAAWARIRAARLYSFERIARLFETTTGHVRAGIHDHQMKGGRCAA